MDVIPMHTALLSDIELFAGACPLRLQLFWLCSGSESVYGIQQTPAVSRRPKKNLV